MMIRCGSCSKFFYESDPFCPFCNAPIPNDYPIWDDDGMFIPIHISLLDRVYSTLYDETVQELIFTNNHFNIEATLFYLLSIFLNIIYSFLTHPLIEEYYSSQYDASTTVLITSDIFAILVLQVVLVPLFLLIQAGINIITKTSGNFFQISRLFAYGFLEITLGCFLLIPLFYILPDNLAFVLVTYQILIPYVIMVFIMPNAFKTVFRSSYLTIFLRFLITSLLIVFLVMYEIEVLILSM